MCPCQGTFIRKEPADTMASQAEFEALKDKNIHVGDWVSLRIRGGHQEGIVKKIATSTEETPHPPKVRTHCSASAF